MVEEKVGVITHFFNHINVAAIKITHGELQVGDTIHITGVHTDFTQTVDSMEIDRESIEKANPGDEIGIKVKKRVRENDEVHKEITE
jgi:putative protease